MFFVEIVVIRNDLGLCIFCKGFLEIMRSVLKMVGNKSKFVILIYYYVRVMKYVFFYNLILLMFYFFV